MDVHFRHQGRLEKDRKVLSSSSSALLMVGPSGVGPFHSRQWRLGFYAQLVESGTNGPYWLFHTQDRKEQSLHLDGLDSETVVRSIVLMLAFALGSENLRGWLEESHNVFEAPNGETQIAPFWEMADDLVSVCVRELKSSARLGVVTLDEMTLLDRQACAHLSELGFDVESFTSEAYRGKG